MGILHGDRASQVNTDNNPIGLIAVAEDIDLSRWFSGAYFLTQFISLDSPTACIAAAVTILVYDTLLTLGDEIRLIWPKKLSAIKILTNLVHVDSLPLSDTSARYGH